MLAYSLLGTILFGGLVDQKTREKFRTRTGVKLEDNYEYLNFNDVLNGMIFLFAILSQNDWSYLATMTTIEIDQERGIIFARVFYLSFYFIGFVVVTNIIIGAILDFIGTYLSILEEEKGKQKTQSNMLNIFELISKTTKILKVKKK